jgi:hypothetical protein
LSWIASDRVLRSIAADLMRTPQGKFRPLAADP